MVFVHGSFVATHPGDATLFRDYYYGYYSYIGYTGTVYVTDGEMYLV
jgi:hypothetical protein